MVEQGMNNEIVAAVPKVTIEGIMAAYVLEEPGVVAIAACGICGSDWHSTANCPKA